MCENIHTMTHRLLYTFLLTILFNYTVLYAQKEAPSWISYADSKLNGPMNTSIFNDYSYSGYDFSESEIPDTSTWTQVNVTDFGAIANDEVYDDQAILDAIKSIEATNQPSVLFFPAGKYLVANEENKDVIIRVRKSNIVFKGAGSGENGTEIFIKERTTPNPRTNSTKFRFQFIPGGSTATTVITNVTADIDRGDFTITVESTDNLQVDQMVQLYTKSTELLTANTPDLSYTPNYGTWKITTEGPEILELHIIEKIEGNQVTFKNPVQLNIPAAATTVQLRQFKNISNVGVEDILFTSGWADFPGTYVHNEDQSLDTGWRAITIQRARDSWIRNCAFKGVTESINLDFTIACTVKNINFSGRGGHTTYNTRYSYGVLFENCDASQDASVHGPGMMRSSVNMVVRNSQMSLLIDQSVDCHGTFPYSNLIDNFQNGQFAQNGGSLGGYPHSGPDLTFWNFTHNFLSRTTTNYDFWNLDRRTGYTYVLPKFVGLQTVPEKIVNINSGEAFNELQGETVYPNSLFDAQLQLRLFNGYMSASSEKEGVLAKFANDNDENTRWNSDGNGAGQWLQLDFGISKTINTLLIKEKFDRVTSYKLEYLLNNEWQLIENGTTLGANKEISFAPVTTRKLRLTFNDTSGSSVSIIDLQVNPNTLSGQAVTDFKNQIQMYPNPFKDNFKVRLGKKQLSTINLYSLNGIKVFSTHQKTKVINLKNLNLPTGIYLVEIITDKDTFISKIVSK